MALSIALLITMTNPVYAADCNKLAAQGLTQSRDQAVATYQRLLTCNKSIAEANFNNYIKVSGDLDNLIALAISAIDADAFNPVWKMLDAVPYENREDVAYGIGEYCATNAKLAPFLQGAYYALHGVGFSQWETALVNCDNDTVSDWVNTTVSAPPDTSFNPKYETMANVVVKRQGAEGLPTLENAAVAASKNGGPFSLLLGKMEDAVKPAEYGADLSPEDRKLLNDSLSRVAKQVTPEQAGAVADRLFNSGSEEAAAGLLSTVYAEKVQEDGTLLYGVAAIEQCDGRAIVHWTTLSDPAKRWSILPAADSSAANFSAKLKCVAPQPWPVVATPQPMSTKDDIEAWVEEISTPWEEKGNKVKQKKEKAIVLE